MPWLHKSQQTWWKCNKNKLWINYFHLAVSLWGLATRLKNVLLQPSRALPLLKIHITETTSVKLFFIYDNTYINIYGQTESSIREQTHCCFSAAMCNCFQAAAKVFPPGSPGGSYLLVSITPWAWNRYIINKCTHNLTHKSYIELRTVFEINVKISFWSVGCTLHPVLSQHICNQLQLLGTIQASFTATFVRTTVIATSNIPLRGPEQRSNILDSTVFRCATAW